MLKLEGQEKKKIILRGKMIRLIECRGYLRHQVTQERRLGIIIFVILILLTLTVIGKPHLHLALRDLKIQLQQAEPYIVKLPKEM